MVCPIAPPLLEAPVWSTNAAASGPIRTKTTEPGGGKTAIAEREAVWTSVNANASRLRSDYLAVWL